MLRSTFVVVALSWSFWAGAQGKRIVILTGANNHDWKRSTEALEAILAEDGTFEVEVVTDPQKLITPSFLEGVDVLLSNWNAFGKKPGAPWSSELKEVYAAYVRGGGGHVAMHAGSSSHYDWEDYQALGAANWGLGKTGHGPVHKFQVRKTVVSHPITAGWDAFETTDELWHLPAVHTNSVVLAESFSKVTGNWEPTAVVTTFGRGRCFTLLLGHSAGCMASDGFKNLLLHGLAWVTGPDLQVETKEDEVSMRVDGQTLWTLHHRPEEGTPYIHPLAALGGISLTDMRPVDHSWHRGLWFSWKTINGVNYWEEDRKTGKVVAGVTRLLSTERSVSENQEVLVRQELEYAPGADTAAVLRESRELYITSLDAKGVYQIDWTSTFTALEADVVLDRTPSSGALAGKRYGGCAGLSLRMNPEMKKGQFFSHTGQWLQHGEQAPWVRFTAPDGSTVQFMDHPDNLKSPTSWYMAPGMPYVSPAILFRAPHTLPAGERLTLCYRLVFSPQIISQEEGEARFFSWRTKEAK